MPGLITKENFDQPSSAFRLLGYSQAQAAACTLNRKKLYHIGFFAKKGGLTKLQQVFCPLDHSVLKILARKLHEGVEANQSAKLAKALACILVVRSNFVGSRFKLGLSDLSPKGLQLARKAVLEGSKDRKQWVRGKLNFNLIFEECYEYLSTLVSERNGLDVSRLFNAIQGDYELLEELVKRANESGLLDHAMNEYKLSTTVTEKNKSAEVLYSLIHDFGLSYKKEEYQQDPVIRVKIMQEVRENCLAELIPSTSP